MLGTSPGTNLGNTFFFCIIIIPRLILLIVLIYSIKSDLSQLFRYEYIPSSLKSILPVFNVDWATLLLVCGLNIRPVCGVGPR